MDRRRPTPFGFGYCTNVHSGVGWEETRSNLERHALAVKARVSPDAEMGVGLWLSARSAREVLESIGVARLREWLEEKGLRAFTFNGFPHGDFHQPRVKHRVYRPDWSEPERLDYTLDLIEILAGLTPEGGEGSLSTLPLGWGKHPSEGEDAACAAQLLRVVDRLVRLEKESGKRLHVDLEPEPGCRLDRHQDVIAFFKEHLLRNADEEQVLRHLCVCHDICHSAVMFEDQAEAFAGYAALGVRIGKVQISSAIRVNLEGLAPADQRAALEQLRGFREDRYLHQTVWRLPNGERQFYEDLPEAIEQAALHPGGELRVHFHVPLFLENTGLLETTQPMVKEGLRLLLAQGGVHHFEVETYAWGVLPEELRSEELAGGIARELLWVKDQIEW